MEGRASQVEEESVDVNYRRILSFMPLPILMMGGIFGELVGAAFLPDGLMEYGPLLYSSVLCALFGLAIGWNKYLWVGVASIIGFVVVLRLRQTGFSQAAIEALIFVGLAVAGAVTSRFIGMIGER